MGKRILIGERYKCLKYLESVKHTFFKSEKECWAYVRLFMLSHKIERLCAYQYKVVSMYICYLFVFCIYEKKKKTQKEKKIIKEKEK